MLNKKTRYAMLALVKLAREYGNGPVPISLISQGEKIPRRFLEGILLHLKNLGIVDSTRGKEGGYLLVRHPAQVSVADIITIFEGSLGMLACVCEKSYKSCEFCRDESACKVRHTFLKVHESTSAILRETTLEKLV